jgi:hypothetical protein
MKASEIKQGIKVLISNDLIWTAKTHSVSIEMRVMRGKKFTIEKIVESEYGMAAVIDTFWWHPKDLTLFKPTPIKKPKTHLFDVKELVT